MLTDKMTACSAIDVAFCIAWPSTISRRLRPTMDVQNWLAHSTA